MKRAIAFLMAFAMSSSALFANEASLAFKVNGKIVKTMTATELKKITNIPVKETELYNVWRSYKKTYVGISLYPLLDSVYKEEWKTAKLINFKALDGYVNGVTVTEMLATATKNSNEGIVAFNEKDQTGFTKFMRGEKEIDPGPLYLVWTGFKESDKGDHKHPLKWPYSFNEIDIITSASVAAPVATPEPAPKK